MEILKLVAKDKKKIKSSQDMEELLLLHCLTVRHQQMSHCKVRKKKKIFTFVFHTVGDGQVLRADTSPELT